jgi:hypothetical protein
MSCLRYESKQAAVQSDSRNWKLDARTGVLGDDTGKRVEREQQAQHKKRTRFNEQLKQIRKSWPQLIPHRDRSLSST